MPTSLDTSGVNPSNRFQQTFVLPSAQYKNFRCVMSNKGPLFRNNHQVYHIQTNGTPVLLEEGVDYLLGHKYVDASKQTNRLIYGSVCIINAGLLGSIRVDANYIGGPYELTTQRVIEALANISTNPRDISYEQLLNIPEAFPPGPHEHTENEAAGIDQVIDGLNDILQAIINRPIQVSPATHSAAVSALNSRIDDLITTISGLSSTVSAGILGPVNTAINSLINRVNNLEIFDTNLTNNHIAWITDTIINSGNFSYSNSVKSKKILVKTASTITWTNEIVDSPVMWLPSASCSQFTFSSVGGKAKFTVMEGYNSGGNVWSTPNSADLIVNTGAVMTLVQSVSPTDIIVEVHPITSVR